MEKKTIDTLRVMLCGEIDDIAKKGNLTHETLDILKDLVETEKNLAKIEKYDEEKEEKEQMMKYGGMSVDNGYSQRKFYIDADYQPYGQSYARGQSYMDGNSYARGQNGRMPGMDMNYGMYSMDNGSSYMYYDPWYSQNSYARGGGYSRAAEKEGLMEELKNMMKETNDEKMKMAISEVLNKMGK